MSKKNKRGRLEPFKPQPAIFRFKAGMPCFEIAKLQEEVKDLRIKLTAQRANTECYKRLYNASLKGVNHSLQKANEARKLLIESKERLISTHKAMISYRRAFNVMRIINIIFTVGVAVMTAILIWR